MSKIDMSFDWAGTPLDCGHLDDFEAWAISTSKVLEKKKASEITKMLVIRVTSTTSEIVYADITLNNGTYVSGYRHSDFTNYLPLSVDTDGYINVINNAAGGIHIKFFYI